ncbi:MAG: hypothetical protein ACRDU8_08405 [Egibacteraceae bacterium]
MTTPTEALAQLRAMARKGALDDFCDDHGVDLLVAFGSATDRAWPGEPRDLDLGVLLGQEPQGPWGMGALVSAFMGLLHLNNVDVVDLGRAGVVARSNALGWGEPLFERTPGLFARQQMRAMGQRMEHGWLTTLGLRTLADR